MKFKHLVSGLVAAFALSGSASAALLVGYSGHSLTVADPGSTWGPTGATSTFTSGGAGASGNYLTNNPGGGPYVQEYGDSSPGAGTVRPYTLTARQTYGSGGADLGGATPVANFDSFYYNGPNDSVDGWTGSPIMALQWTVTNGNTHHALVLDNLYYDIGRTNNAGLILNVAKYDSSDVLVETIISNHAFTHTGVTPDVWTEHANHLGVSLDVSEKLIITWYATTSADYVFDNLALSGNFYIPEPGNTFALAGLIASGLLLRSRRKAA